MNKIKSLVYREFLISKKFYITTIAVIILFMTMGWLLTLSLKTGNLEKLIAEEAPEFISVATNIIYYVFNYFTAFVCGALINESGIIMSDIKSNWRTFSFTLPATEKEKSLAKTIIKVTGVVAAFLFCIINGLVLSCISGIDFELKNISIYAMIIDYWVIFDFLSTLLQLRARNEKEILIARISPVVLMILLFPAVRNLMDKITSGIPDSENDEMITENMSYAIDILSGEINRITPFAFPVMILFLAGGFFLNMQMMKRRYK